MKSLLNQRGRVPGTETVRQARFFVDVCFMLYMRRVHKTQRVVFWQIDSSPQAGHNWLIASYTAVPIDKLCLVFDSWQRLCLASVAVSTTSQGEFVDVDEDGARGAIGFVTR